MTRETTGGSPRPERPPAAGSGAHKGSLSRIQDTTCVTRGKQRWGKPCDLPILK